MRTSAVVVAHRETMVAEGLAAALGRFPAVTPVGVATTALDAEQTARRVDADAVVLDVALVGGDEAASRLRKAGVRVILLDADAIGHADAPAERELGADEQGGLRVKTSGPVSSLASALVPGCHPPPGRSTLTPRETDVLRLIARGFTAKRIARHLGISVKTVERHKTKMYAKLGVSNQAAAAAALVAIAPETRQWNPSNS